MILAKEKKNDLISKFKINLSDTGSAHVQIALLTERINYLTEHAKIHKKDFSSIRGLLKLVSKRKKLLDYLKGQNFKAYQELIERLGLRK